MSLEVPGSLKSLNSQENIYQPHPLLLVGLIVFGLTAHTAPAASDPTLFQAFVAHPQKFCDFAPGRIC